MKRKMLTLLAVPLVALAIAVSDAAFVPGLLRGLSGSPSTAAVSPAWKIGDSWTYNVSVAALGEASVIPSELTPQPAMPSEAFVAGTLTETVVGSVSTDYGAAWNVSLTADCTSEPPRPILMGGPISQGQAGPSVTWTGFVWLRESDLAPIYSWKAVQLDRNWTLTFGTTGPFGMQANGTYRLSLDATTQVWYRPALAVLRFPLEENATWNVSSNATIRYASTFRVIGPNVTWTVDHSGNFTVPMGFAVRTGPFSDATTPAGTFRVLPVSLSRDVMIPDRDASAVMNLTAGADLELPHAFATGWFSDQVGNIVKATLAAGALDGPRIELDLVSYTYT